MLISDRRLYVTADGSRVVEEGDPDGAFLLVGAGSEIRHDVAEKHKLRVSKGKVSFPAPKAKKAKAEPKAKKAKDASRRPRRPTRRRADPRRVCRRCGRRGRRGFSGGGRLRNRVARRHEVRPCDAAGC